MVNKEQLISKAIKMKPAEKAEIIDRLLQSLDKPDEQIDRLWKKEAEERIDAYEDGKISSASLQEVIEKYKQD
jgi:putative addiction module component (TIGR02574 family)